MLNPIRKNQRPSYYFDLDAGYSRHSAKILPYYCCLYFEEKEVVFTVFFGGLHVVSFSNSWYSAATGDRDEQVFQSVQLVFHRAVRERAAAAENATNVAILVPSRTESIRLSRVKTHRCSDNVLQ